HGTDPHQGDQARRGPGRHGMISARRPPATEAAGTPSHRRAIPIARRRVHVTRHVGQVWTPTPRGPVRPPAAAGEGSPQPTKRTNGGIGSRRAKAPEDREPREVPTMAAITIESLQSHEETSELELRRLSLAVGVWEAIATSPGEPVHRHVGWAEAVE